jgi:hypothetical protein
MSSRPELLTALCVMLCSVLWISWLAASPPQNARIISNQNRDKTHAQAHTKTNANGTLDACSLLTGTDIAAILGEPLQELKPSLQATGNMKMSQCLFVTRNFAKSASLAVATPVAEDSGARGPRAFWRNQFHSPHRPEEEKRPAARKIPAKSAFAPPSEDRESKVSPFGKSDSEANREPDSAADEAASKPRRIPALGEEAYWVGSPISGALYVLQGDLFLRISVGGIPKESTRIAKSKSLATAILSRLPHKLR